MGGWEGNSAAERPARGPLQSSGGQKMEAWSRVRAGEMRSGQLGPLPSQN